MRHYSSSSNLNFINTKSPIRKLKRRLYLSACIEIESDGRFDTGGTFHPFDLEVI